MEFITAGYLREKHWSIHNGILDLEEQSLMKKIKEQIELKTDTKIMLGHPVSDLLTSKLRRNGYKVYDKIMSGITYTYVSWE